MSLSTFNYLDSVLLSPGLITLGCFAVLLCLTQTKTLSPAAFLESVKCRVNKRLALITYPFNAKATVQDAYIQGKGKPVELIQPESDVVTFVTSSRHIKDIANAQNDELSLHAAAKMILKPEYTMAGFNWHNQRGIDGIGFVRALRTLLTNHLPALTDDVRVLVDKTFKNDIGKGGVANSMNLIKTVATKFTAFSFFGPEYMEDEEFMDAALYYNHDVMLGSEILRLTPSFLEPFVGKFIPLFLKRQRTFYYGLSAIFEKRLANPNKDEKFDDVIQWIIDTSPKSKPWTPGRMAFEIMAIWFGSVEGLSTTLLFAVYNLCTHPEYMTPLREEIESPACDEFFRTGDGLPLLDSFLKESSRWTPVESVSTRRKALKDFTFFDGTFIKKDNWVCVPVGAMLRDENMYPQPNTFDGFRFVDPKKMGREQSIQPEGPSKFTDISDTWQVWGTGKILCPGRFFVSFAMKHIMVHIIKNYEPEIVDKESSPTLNWRTWTLPKPGVKVDFKPRVTV